MDEQIKLVLGDGGGQRVDRGVAAALRAADRAVALLVQLVAVRAQVGDGGDCERQRARSRRGDEAELGRAIAGVEVTGLAVRRQAAERDDVQQALPPAVCVGARFPAEGPRPLARRRAQGAGRGRRREVEVRRGGEHDRHGRGLSRQAQVELLGPARRARRRGRRRGGGMGVRAGRGRGPRRAHAVVVGAAVLVLDALAVALALPVLAVLAALARARVIADGGRRRCGGVIMRVGFRARCCEQHRRERGRRHGMGAARRGGAAARPLMTLPVNEPPWATSAGHQEPAASVCMAPLDLTSTVRTL